MFWGPRPSLTITAKAARNILAKLIELESKEIDEITQLFSAIDFLSEESEQQKTSFAEKVGEQIDEFSSDDAKLLYSVICATIDDLDQEGFSLDDLVDSLPKLDFSDEKLNKLSKFFTDIHKKTNYYSQQKERSYQNIGPNRLINLSWAVDLRGIFQKQFDYDSTDSVNYDPKIESIIPMVLLECSLQNPFNEVIMQLSEEDLNKLINNLLAAQKQLIELKRAVEVKNA